MKVIAFDTFGTVADWYTGVSHVLAQTFPQIDSSQLARDWRRTYGPVLAEVEAGDREWTMLDDLHRETLERLLRERYDVCATPAQLDVAVHAWHVLPGWPDSSSGLHRLKAKYTICALSNGNVALLNEMAKASDLPWDFVGGSDLWRRYKPASEVYLGLARLMQVHPSEVLMVATHVSDLAAARSFGLRTAYVERPSEWGPEPKDEAPNPADDFHVRGIDELATQLGC
ncbi:haloacid dehalogenase, type II [Gordonia neofelifaecis NRRL B-59395]|uniref:Haloacid dehalogenase, type II n=1 Tax=Gordonia neofelifaecis NRRL B-59395 TaxID=644548 RepID=F1YFP6_9ACTN|nr:haloacid dehalogenase, type II [Gordonia neofelifaecis NRRL B-59395]